MQEGLLLVFISEEWNMMNLKNLRIWSREGFSEHCYLTVEGSRIAAIGPMSD